MMERRGGYTFCKEERLCGEKRFTALVTTGKSFISYPIRVVYLIADRGEGESPVSIGVSISKKRAKSAVLRNRIKRLIREAYRQNKYELYLFVPENKRIDILFISLESNGIKYAKMEKAIIGALKKIANSLE